MNDLIEFLNSEESKEILKNLTIVERVKYATAFQWAGTKPTPKQAEEKAKGKCSEEAVAKRHEEGNYSFESELASIYAIKDVASLSDEETARFDDEVFTKKNISDDLKQKINSAIAEKGTEDAVIDALCAIHDNWMKNHGNNFQKSGRDKDYQFVDLRLMPFGDDGATADLIFLRPMLEECGIQIDMAKLEQRFNEMQVEFLKEKGIASESDLREYLSKGAESNRALEGLVAGDETGRTIDEILRTNPEVVKHMAGQVMSKLPEQARFDTDKLTPGVMGEYSEEIQDAEIEIRGTIEHNKDEESINQSEENR